MRITRPRKNPTPHRYFDGEKIFIHDHFQDGHINLYLNDIASRLSDIDGLSKRLRAVVGVAHHDQKGAGKRVWKVSWDQYIVFLKESTDTSIEFDTGSD